jgi:branched-subunit amino acid transport protein AzlD
VFRTPSVCFRIALDALTSTFSDALKVPVEYTVSIDVGIMPCRVPLINISSRTAPAFMQDEQARQIFYWFTDPSEPPSHPIYAVLFGMFFLAAVLGVYLYRALPDWVMDSPRSRRARGLMLAISIVAVIGDTLIIFQLMQVPFVSRRLWLGITTVLTAGLVLALVFVRKQFTTGDSLDESLMD